MSLKDEFFSYNIFGDGWLRQAIGAANPNNIKQGELQFLRDRFCAQCEEHAEGLLPEVSLIKTRMPKRELVAARQEINPLEDPLY